MTIYIKQLFFTCFKIYLNLYLHNLLVLLLYLNIKPQNIMFNYIIIFLLFFLIYKKLINDFFYLTT